MMNQCLLEPRVKYQQHKRREPPPFYSVYLKNGNHSPLDFIIEVIRIFFFFPYEQAKNMIEEMPAGRGKIFCGVYTKDVAETKVQQVNRYLKKYKYALTCEMELA